MSYTVETAYEAMKQGAKNEKGDPVHEWLFTETKPNKHGNMKMMRRYIRAKHFDEFVYNYKIFERCKHTIPSEPIKEGEEVDDDELDDEGNRINWLLIHVYHLLFSNYWYDGKTHLQTIVDHLYEIKQQLIDADYLDVIPYLIQRYEKIMGFLKEWIKQSNITTKAELIKHLPLDVDCNQTIYDMYKHELN